MLRSDNDRNQNSRRRNDPRVTCRPPELFLRIVTPSGLEFGWPVHKGWIGYKVAEEIVGPPRPQTGPWLTRKGRSLQRGDAEPNGR